MSNKLVIHISKLQIWQLLLWLLGISLSTNLISIFRIGNVNVSLAQFLVIVMAIGLVFKRIRLLSILTVIKTSFRLWLILVPISFVFLLISNTLSLASTYFAGVIELIAVLLAIIVISNKQEYSNSILSGLVYGLLLNVLISIIAYIKWRVTGSSFNFGETFHLDSYAYYDHWRFRAQGFFTESSYFVCYVCVTTPIALLIHPVKRIGNKTILILSVISLALSLSGNILIYICELILCFIYFAHSEERTKKYNIIIGVTCAIPIILILFFTIGPSIPFIRDLLDKVVEGLQGSNLLDSSNKPRLDNMKAALELFKLNPLGYGYNMGAVVLQSRSNISGAASTFLRMLLDLGVLGGLAYCFIFYQYSIKNLFGARKSIYERSFGIALIGLFACQVSNGYPFASVLTMTVLGLSAIHKSDFM